MEVINTNAWLNLIKTAKKCAIQQGNLRKIHYEFSDGKEMVEEYNMDTNVLTRRAWKKKNDLGGEGAWDIEIGDPEPAPMKTDGYIKESSEAPFITRRVTKQYLEWRIRNLPYSSDVFSVTADANTSGFTVRTSNKKYFKKIIVPELQRIGMNASQQNIAFTHKFNTLIITYKKPKEILELEKIIFKEICKVQVKKDDFGDCKPS